MQMHDPHHGVLRVRTGGAHDAVTLHRSPRARELSVVVDWRASSRRRRHIQERVGALRRSRQSPAVTTPARGGPVFGAHDDNGARFASSTTHSRIGRSGVSSGWVCQHHVRDARRLATARRSDARRQNLPRRNPLTSSSVTAGASRPARRWYSPSARVFPDRPPRPPGHRAPRSPASPTVSRRRRSAR
jgi:hypothetical protein